MKNGDTCERELRDARTEASGKRREFEQEGDSVEAGRMRMQRLQERCRAGAELATEPSFDNAEGQQKGKVRFENPRERGWTQLQFRHCGDQVMSGHHADGENQERPPGAHCHSRALGDG